MHTFQVTLGSNPQPTIEYTANFEHTKVSVVNCDTATALRTAVGLHPTRKVAALNFANANHIGGGYTSGACAQEEDLCRLMPMLHTQLSSKREFYPLREDAALFTRTALCRMAGTYQLTAPLPVNIITSAMPNMGSPEVVKALKGLRYEESVRTRMRAVLNAAVHFGVEVLILGAFGCGAFRNNSRTVARLFQEVLSSSEFAGAFSHITFAILEVGRMRTGGNLAVFREVFGAPRERGTLSKRVPVKPRSAPHPPHSPAKDAGSSSLVPCALGAQPVGTPLAHITGVKRTCGSAR